MRLITNDPTIVRAEGAEWSAKWIDAAPFRGVPVRILDIGRTALATITSADVAYYQQFGRWPEFDRMALDPAWGYPDPAADGTAGRRDFHRWRAEGGVGFSGRPILFDYDTAALARQLRSYALAVQWQLKDYNGEIIKFPTFRRLAMGATYWWVQAGDPSWMGWTWTDTDKRDNK